MTNDLFNFRDYVLFLKDKLDNTELSQVVWVHWDYWSWKTTTMNIIKELYQEDVLLYDNILEFSAWRNYYNNEQTVWKALLYELAGKIYDVFDSENITFEWVNDDEILKYINCENIKKEKWYHRLNFNLTKEKPKDLLIKFIQNTSKEIQYNLYQDLKDFEWNLEKWKSEADKYPYIAVLQCISWLFDVLNENKTSSIVELWKLLKKEEQELKKPKIDSLEVIQRKFDILLSFYNLIWEKNKKPLIIMVDDLDRILPEKSVEIIEILRIFFEKSSKIHFICAIDLRVIEKWIERKFNQLNKWWDLSRIEFEEYLEKIITIPFDLPAIPLVDFDPDNNFFWINTLINNKVSDKINDNNKWSIELIKNKITNIIILDYYNNLKPTIEDFLIEYYSNNSWEIDIDRDIKNFKKYNIEISSINYHINDKKIEFKIKKMEEKLSISIKDVESKCKEYSLLKKVKQDYKENIEKINTITFKNIIKTWLQANPRKIKRFIDVFEIYFKILMYRKYNLDNKDFTDNDLKKYSALLAKMLIIKLEWDEVYKEFVRDKYHLLFIEYVAKNIKEWNMKISFNIAKYIKDSKKYRISNLFWMLSIMDYFIEKDIEDSKKLLGIYAVYYLYPFIWNHELQKQIESNENYETLWNVNLLKYLYEYDEQKVLLYCNEIFKNTDNISSIISSFKEFMTSKNSENITNIKILNDNLNINGK